jgi:hypothetical protein
MNKELDLTLLESDMSFIIDTLKALKDKRTQVGLKSNPSSPCSIADTSFFAEAGPALSPPKRSVSPLLSPHKKLTNLNECRSPMNRKPNKKPQSSDGPYSPIGPRGR